MYYKIQTIDHDSGQGIILVETNYDFTSIPMMRVKKVYKCYSMSSPYYHLILDKDITGHVNDKR